MPLDDYPISQLKDPELPFFEDIGRTMADDVKYERFTMCVSSLLDSCSTFEPKKAPSILYLRGSKVKNGYYNGIAAVQGTKTSTEVIERLIERKIINGKIALSGLRASLNSINLKKVASRDEGIRRYDLRASLLDTKPPTIIPELNAAKKAFGLDSIPTNSYLAVLLLGTISTSGQDMPLDLSSQYKLGRLLVYDKLAPTNNTVELGPVSEFVGF